MDRTILDRTILDIRRAEEKELSELLYNKLQALTLIHPPTNEFKSIFTKDMFLKANQKACLYVMHFLLTLYLDPEEYKMKFFWPIIDKKSESLFRSSVVNYLTELNQKHNFKWTHLKNYLISVPGGIKFITFLLELIDFIVSELIKKREKELPNHKIIKNCKLTKSVLNETLTEYENFKKYAKEYEEQIDASRSRIKQNTDMLQVKLNEISLQTGITLKELTDKNLLNDFQLNNQQLFKELITEKIKTIHNAEKSLVDFKNNIDLSYQENAKKSFDKDQLVESFNEIQLSYSELKNENILKNNELNFQTLLTSFNRILTPEIYNSIQIIESNDLDSFTFKETELRKIIQDVQDLENEINEFEESFNYNKNKNDGNDNRHNLNNDNDANGACAIMTLSTPIATAKTPSKLLIGDSILHKLYVNTPPISINHQNYPNNNVNKQRLPFLKDTNFNESIKSEFDRMSSLLLHSHSIHHKRNNNNNNNDSIKSYNSRLKHLKYDNPVHMIKMLTKHTLSPRKKSSLANSRENYHQQQQQHHQSLFKYTLPQSTSSCSTGKSSGTLPKHRILQQKESFRISPQFKLIESTPKLPRLSAEYDYQKMSTSPSGRLDPIISVSSSSSLSTTEAIASSSSATIFTSKKDTSNKDLSKRIYIKEKSLIFEQSSNDNLFNKSILEETKINIKIYSEDPKINSKNDNDDNKIETKKICSEFNQKLNLIGNNHDSICNVSDTILNDVME